MNPPIPGDIISYTEMCSIENVRLQKGMNFRLKGGPSVILMSVRKGAPYTDQVLDDGNILIYEGHNVARNEAKNPKSVDQPGRTRLGSLTENGKFYQIVESYKSGETKPELVKVYEKIKPSIWVYTGIFELVDAWVEKSDGRKVFKFKLQASKNSSIIQSAKEALLTDLAHTRMIPTDVKLHVWKRDKGVCVQCGSNNNLHFDHILPFSKGGTSLKPENIQLLCARHNLEKTDKIL